MVGSSDALGGQHAERRRTAWDLLDYWAWMRSLLSLVKGGSGNELRPSHSCIEAFIERFSLHLGSHRRSLWPVDTRAGRRACTAGRVLAEVAK